MSENPTPGAAIAMEGFVQAIESVVGVEPRENQIAIGQALFWGITLDELLKKAHSDAYENARDGHVDGRVVDGARLARNAITHGAVIVQSVQGGLEWPLVFPIMWGSPAWVPLNELTQTWTPELRPRLPLQKVSYSDHFASRPGVEPLLRMKAWLLEAARQGYAI